MNKMRLLPCFLVTAAAIGLSTAIPGFTTMAFADAENQEKTIYVTAEGHILVQPDVAYIQLGVQTQENSVEQAQSENADTLQKIYTALEKEHIKQDDIQTVSFNINPVYSWDQNKQTFQGYQVIHILRITDRDLDHMGSLLDQMSQSGANRIDSIQYDTEKREQYQLDALDLAIDQAQQKANHIAEKIGKTNLSIISLRESNSSPVPMFTQEQKMAANDSGTQISTGQITITANVDVTYSF